MKCQPSLLSYCCLYYDNILQKRDIKFDFPNIFPADAKKVQEDDAKSLEETKKNYRKYLDKNKSRPGTPGWFTI